MDKLSVLIPTYNRATLLPEAVHSVLSQTYRELEVVVIDDGSTDDTAAALARINDRRLRYLPQPHRGVGATLNAGWQAVTSEYIARLDSDDVWLPELVGALLPRLEENANVMLAYGRAQMMRADGTLLPQLLGAPPKFSQDALASLLYGDCVTPMAVIMRRDALAQVGGYDERLIGNEDWDLWLRLAERGSIVYVERVLAHYRLHAQNLTHARAEQNQRLIQDRLAVLDRYYARQDAPPRALEMKKIAYRNLYQDVALRHLSAHRRALAVRFFARSVVVAPNPVTAFLRGIRSGLYQLGLGKTRLGVWAAGRWQARRAAASH